jgi:hypothetical protein
MCRGSMQAISRDQTAEEIFVVVGNSGCRGTTPIFACWSVHAQAPRVGPFSRTSKDKPSSASVRRCRYFALARWICRGIPGSRGHRRWKRFGRSDFLDKHISGFTSSECCNLYGNWIDILVFWRSIFQFLSKAFARLGLYSQPAEIRCTNVCQLPISPNCVCDASLVPETLPSRSSNNHGLGSRSRHYDAIK